MERVAAASISTPTWPARRHRAISIGPRSDPGCGRGCRPAPRTVASGVEDRARLGGVPRQVVDGLELGSAAVTRYISNDIFVDGSVCPPCTSVWTAFPSVGHQRATTSTVKYC